MTMTGLFPAVSFSQPEKIDTAMMRSIRQEENNHSQVTMIAHNIADVCGPRLTNSPGYQKAVSWVTQILKEWGLQHAGPEAWGEFGRGWSTEKSYLAMRQPYYQSFIACPVAWTNGTAKPITAPVFLLDKLDSASIDKAGDSLKGKIIMIRSANTNLRSAFTAYSSRFSDSDLNNMHNSHMLSKEELNNLLTYFVAEYKSKLYLQSKGPVALLSSGPSDRDGTIAVSGAPPYGKNFAAILPELAVSREDYLKMQRLKVY